MNDGNQWQPSAANPAEDGHRDEDGDGVRGADEQLPGAPDDSKLDHRDRDGRRYQREAQGPTLDDRYAPVARCHPLTLPKPFPMISGNVRDGLLAE